MTAGHGYPHTTDTVHSIAAYYISYGAHGPRAPIVPPNTNGKVFIGVVAGILAAVGIFAGVRMICRFGMVSQQVL